MRAGTLKKALLLLSCWLLCDPSAAVVRKTKPAAISVSKARPSPPNPAAIRSSAPVFVATTTAEGQAGYVHYFVIVNPDESLETQVGIELDDQRIAWSFPELGVVVSPFIASGSLTTNGRVYGIKHLYGVRPFPDDDAMRVLQRELTGRVVPWVEAETPYCFLRASRDPFCLSCIDFVARILFSRRYPEPHVLPRGIERTGPGVNYTTDDLLFYLVGLHGLPTEEARLNRLSELTLPSNLREDLLQIIGSFESDGESASALASAPRKPAVKRRPSLGKIVQQRPQQPRKL
jgi:hypothetical protein